MWFHMQHGRSLFLGVLSLLLVQATLSHSQQLMIESDTGRQTVLALADINALPHIKVSTTASGTPVTFEGVAVRAVLEKAGIGFGESLRGKRLALCLLIEASDGYRVVIALPEIDPAFNDKQVILAFLKDGKPLDSNEGPYRIVIPDEKRMARWVREVTLKDR